MRWMLPSSMGDNVNALSGKKWLQEHGKLIYYGGIISFLVYVILLQILLVLLYGKVDKPSVILIVATLLIPVFILIIYVGSRTIKAVSLQKVMRRYSLVKHHIETDNQYIMKSSKFKTLPFLFILVVILVPILESSPELGYSLLGYIFLVGIILFVIFYTAVGNSLTLNSEGITVRTLISRRSCRWKDIKRFEVREDPLSEFSRKLVYFVINDSCGEWLGGKIIPEASFLQRFKNLYEKTIADNYGWNAEELAMLLNMLREYFSGDGSETGIE